MHPRIRKSFTLIELLLVVVILSILGAMVVPRLVGRSEQARVAVARTDIASNIATALELYEMENGMFPTTEQGLTALKTKPTSSPVPTNWNGPYIKRTPKDPWGSQRSGDRGRLHTRLLRRPGESPWRFYAARGRTRTTPRRRLATVLGWWRHVARDTSRISNRCF